MYKLENSGYPVKIDRSFVDLELLCHIISDYNSNWGLRDTLTKRIIKSDSQRDKISEQRGKRLVFSVNLSNFRELL